MDKGNLIGTGLSGLVGSRIVELLHDTYNIENISRKTGTDILQKEAIIDRIKKSPSMTVLHVAAKTDVDGCEKEKDLGKQGEAWKINVDGTQNVIDACQETGKKLIYISTDMVFSGDKKLGDFYTEEDIASPCNWYAQTKFEAEKLVVASGIPYVILRIAYPYRANFEKKEYVRIFLSLLRDKKQIKVVTDNFFTPTFIDDIPAVIDLLIKQNQTGIFHLGGGQTVSPFDVAMKVAQVFNLDQSLIQKTTREEFFKERANRPFNTSLKNAKITKLGVFEVHTFDQGINSIKTQLQ